MLIRKKSKPETRDYHLELYPQTPLEHSLCEALCEVLQSRSSDAWLDAPIETIERVGYYSIMARGRAGGVVVFSSHRIFHVEPTKSDPVWS